MSAPTFAEALAEKCVQMHSDHHKTDFLHIRDRSAVAILSVSPSAVHCPLGGALALVRGAVVGLIEEGIEEGRRWQSVSPEALAAAREEGHEAGIAVGWTRALAVAVRMVEALQEREEMAKRELRRCTDELRVAEAIRSAISEASPVKGGYDEPR